MASGIDKKLSMLLECAVCLERFRDPKVLSCQHIYCRECLEKLESRNLRPNDVAKIECPECRKKTKIPGGDVKNLQNNFLINKLLSDLDSHTDRKLFCKKHDDEKLKLFCQTCDLLICRDCIVIDHSHHTYKFVKDIYPSEKKKIEKAVKESKAKISDLEATIKYLDDLEREAQVNCKKVSSEVDAFIDKQVALLEKRRTSLKTELKQLARVQREERNGLIEGLTTSLNRVKQEVGLAEQIMKSSSKEEVLANKKQIMKALNTEEKTSSTVRKRKHEFEDSYYLEVYRPLNNKMLKNMGKIRKREKVCCGKDDDDGDQRSMEGTSKGKRFSSSSTGSSLSRRRRSSGSSSLSPPCRRLCSLSSSSTWSSSSSTSLSSSSSSTSSRRHRRRGEGGGGSYLDLSDSDADARGGERRGRRF